MEQIRFKEFASDIIKEIKKLTYDPNASCCYEMMSGGLVWSDEINKNLMEKLLRDDNSNFTFLFGYRTSVIREKESEGFRLIYETMTKHFPDWPGLRKERWNPKLKALLVEKERAVRKKCLQTLKEFDE